MHRSTCTASNASLAALGYTATGDTVTAELDNLTVAALGVVGCARGWKTTTTATPSATCERQAASGPVASFGLDGCAEKMCTAPGQTTVSNAEGDYSVAAPGVTVASALGLSCGPSSNGTASAVCETEGSAFEYSGCEWRTCAALAEVPSSYSVAEASGTTVPELGVTCVHGGDAVVTCGERGEFELSGCLPQQTSAAQRCGALLAPLLALGASWLCL